nr:ABC transporter permease subunit [uncultured Anaerosporobacter sp.]
MNKKKKEISIHKQKFSFKLMYRQRYLLVMSVPFVIWLIIFKYIPLWGWTMAFQDVKPKTFALSIWERTWVGFDHFKALLHDGEFFDALRNTLGISFIGIVLGFITSVGFALLLNEVRLKRFKKVTQTISYLPHFVSWVIIASIAKMVLGDSGVLNEVLGKIGVGPIKFMTTNGPAFWLVVCIINIWKETGWDAIIYLSAMTGIDQGLYEAAKVDGAGRFRRMWHITLPGIRPTIIVLVIMSIGGVLGAGMERQMLLGNGIVQDYADVVSWYAYRFGIGNNNYGFGTAVGVFQSAISLVLLFVANKVAGKFSDSKLV